MRKKRTQPKARTKHPAVDPRRKRVVWPLVMKDVRKQCEMRRFLQNREHLPDAVEHALLEDMLERDAVGRERYGVPLTTNNGRDGLLDAYEELLDAAVYLRQHLAEHSPSSLWAVYEQTLHSAYAVRRERLKRIRRAA